jgi:hypothetical protein
MRAIAKSLVLMCVVGCMIGVWSAKSGHDEVVAQESVPTLTDMYTGPDGLTHFREIPIPTGLMKVVGVQFDRPNPNQAPNQRTLQFHNAPHHRYVITLSGHGEIVSSGDNNKMFIADRDHMLLAEDITGKGHTTKGIDWVTLFVEVDPKPAESSSR